MYKLGRYISVLFLVLILTGKMLASYIILLDYNSNKDYISKYLCENRFNTSLNCEGKCLLMQKLKKAAETPDSGKEQKTAVTLSVEFVEDLPTYTIERSFASTNIQHFIRNKEEFHSIFLVDIFHPPAV
ncbi:MAG: hypothetical protein A1D16_09405 [Flavihumibacter sp. CACIAM 22H1]|nr:MAG: hypothetical protein A1D16_09405 [Flavihumibacter sp. CACIAM 22H1]